MIINMLHYYSMMMVHDHPPSEVAWPNRNGDHVGVPDSPCCRVVTDSSVFEAPHYPGLHHVHTGDDMPVNAHSMCVAISNLKNDIHYERPGNRCR